MAFSEKLGRIKKTLQKLKLTKSAEQLREQQILKVRGAVVA